MRGMYNPIMSKSRWDTPTSTIPTLYSSSGSSASGAPSVRSWPFILATPRWPRLDSRPSRPERARNEFHGILARAKQKKVDVYLDVGELAYPQNLFPEMRDPDQDGFWNFVGDRAEEILGALPDVAGLIVYLDETQHKIYDLDGGQPVEDYIFRLLKVYLAACSQHHKRLIVSTFTNYYPSVCRRWCVPSVEFRLRITFSS